MAQQWDKLACNTFATLNFAYGCVSWFASIAWGRHILFRQALTEGVDVIRPIEYYAVVVGLLNFHAAVLTLLLRDVTAEKTRILHAWAQVAYWLLNGGVGVYFAITEVYRPEAGFGHATVAFLMAALAIKARQHIVSERHAASCERVVASFTLGDETDDTGLLVPRTAKRQAKMAP